ncbi:ribosomal protein S10 [Fomitopsis serialis]|uniref:ribosomal protein S10 n=1 Tax=Fomitopsis serialis TaxID=139415 RepID=UPI0020079B18|nr:ribosomal protein S10 [Neoantrodia serialis]KAH9917760.1 ribosomal protein S10 [Neoantrodia serialis]
MFANSCKAAWRRAQRMVRFNSTAAAATNTTSPTAVSAGQDPAERAYSSVVVRGRALFAPHYHPKTHGVPVALIHFRSYHLDLLNEFTHFSAHAAAALGIPISKTVPLPTKRTLWTVIRGPFAHKKSQENFERRTHKRLIKAWDADMEVVDRWAKYLEEHTMAGVGIRVVRWHRAPVSIGRKQFDAVMGQMRLGGPTSSDQVKALGEKIVQQELAAVEGREQVEPPEKAS